MLYFIALGLVCALAATTGNRGQVCDPVRGYNVPEHVRKDPALEKKANDIVAFWCTGASIMALPPVIVLPTTLSTGASPSLPALVVLAAYGLATGLIARYPFERISRLTPDQTSNKP